MVVTHLQPNIIFSSRTGVYASRVPNGTITKGRLLVLPTNNRQLWKGAYEDKERVTAVIYLLNLPRFEIKE